VLRQGSIAPAQQCPAGNTDPEGFLTEDQGDSLKPINTYTPVNTEMGPCEAAVAALH